MNNYFLKIIKNYQKLSKIIKNYMNNYILKITLSLLSISLLLSNKN